MDHIKPFKIQTCFSFRVPNKYISHIYETQKTNIFDLIEIKNTTKTHSKISYSIMMTIQKMDINSLNSSLVVRFEKRFRNDFFNRIKGIKKNISDLSEKTSIEFNSGIYKPR